MATVHAPHLASPWSILRVMWWPKVFSRKRILFSRLKMIHYAGELGLMYKWLAPFFYRSHIFSQKDIFYTVNITFLEVKMEDYGHPFVCHAGVSAAYFILKLPGNVLRDTRCSESSKWWQGDKCLLVAKQYSVGKLSINFLFGIWWF